MTQTTQTKCGIMWKDYNELAEHFGVSVSTIFRWEKKGLPYHKIGGVKRYNVEECDTWFIQQNKVKQNV